MIMIQEKLTTWFNEQQRDLPWRKGYLAYEIWISEIMLQQTQVKTVLPYFKRWMEKLPSISDVAEADEDVILKLWEGLGYYSRARNLHAAAKAIVAEHEGQLPRDHEALLKLPGIGPYTAGAIMSIAFNEPFPIVDGNVIRLLARLNDFHGLVNSNKKQFWTWAEELVDKSRDDLGGARAFNQGMMELGALICTPKNPACGLCPLMNECKAFKNETVLELPNKGKGKKITPLKVVIAAIERDGKFFIQKRPAKGLMAGLWEFPGGKVEEGESLEIALKRELMEETELEVADLKKVSQIKHAYTSFKVDLHCYLARYERGHVKLNGAQEGKWASLEELSEHAFPAANVKFIEALKKRF
jgi:A/G-specific adenine glycosylase